METQRTEPMNRQTIGGQPIDRLIRPFQDFAQHRLAGSILLLAATGAALAWANSPWRHSYHELFEAPITLTLGHFTLSKSVHHWINDGLMGVFFFVVGLEIKREILVGQLSSFRRAMLPIAAAVGGMVVPGALYWAFNAGGPGQSGWGIPMATDIAFALGVLALLGSRIPVGLKVFLTALAIVDDIGAIVVIAVFYTDSIAIVALLAGGGLVGVSLVANLLGVRSAVFYFVIGTAVWLCFLESGVHATLAAVLMAMTIPARTRLSGGPFLKRLTCLTDLLDKKGLKSQTGLLSNEQQTVLHEIGTTLSQGTAPLQRLEHSLAPLTTLFVLPAFAFANAGVEFPTEFGGILTDPVFVGIVVGLFFGKQIGIFAFAWLALRLGLAELPPGVSVGQIHAVAVLGGMGFTMSLFVAFLALPDAASIDTAKMGIFSATLLSAVVGYALLRAKTRME